jgi:hypothetical protein
MGTQELNLQGGLHHGRKEKGCEEGNEEKEVTTERSEVSA